MDIETQKPEDVLKAEREALENKMALATDTGRPQVAEVDGKKVVIIDRRHAGRQIIAFEEIGSVI
ncbi:MAG: hypothetical protein AAB535_00985 [Patescibacteria group bacterium]